MKIRVGFFCGSRRKYSSGLDIYIKDLVNGILNITQDIDPTLLFTISRYSLRHRELEGFTHAVHVKQFPLPEEIMLRLWNTIRFPSVDLLGGSFDIVHGTISFLPPVIRSKKVVTVHDLIPFVLPELSLLSKEKAKIISKSLKYADLIISDSENTKEDLINIFRIKKENINVIYPGLDPVFGGSVDLDLRKAILRKYNIQNPYILYVGNIDPRKNINRLITAYAEAVGKKKINEDLLLIGGWTHRSAEVLSVLKDNKIGSRVRYLGYVSRKDMPALYSTAKLFVFPSFYEGFGYPVLEAMACGVPVICSKVSSLPEIGDDAVCYIDPKSTEDITNAISRLLSNDNIRSKMTNKGRQRAALFNWDRAAKEYYMCYRKLVNF